MPLALTTELQAVNALLAAVRQAPVQTITGDLGADTAMAKALLEDRSRAVQSARWHFNTVPELTLSPNTSSEIVLPEGVVQADVLPGMRTDIDVTVRGEKLFDKKNATYTFTKDVKVVATYLLDWTELPEQARSYIFHSAARRFQDRLLGSREDHFYQQQDEAEALAILKLWDSEQADNSIFQTDVTLNSLLRY